MLSCPDCTAADAKVIMHDDTCPTLHGVEQVCAVDAAWFDTHPFSNWRWRDLAAAERAEVEMAGYSSLDGRHCRVLVVNDGAGRHRRTIASDGKALLVIVDIPPARGWAA